MMDWTLYDDASTPLQRIKSTYYLFREGYHVDPKRAAAMLAAEAPDHPLCQQILAELRAEMATPSTNLGSSSGDTDAAVRDYLRNLLTAYDQKSSGNT